VKQSMIAVNRVINCSFFLL